MSTMVSGVVPKVCPNSSFHWFETSREVSECSGEVFFRPGRKGIVAQSERVGALGNKIALAILKIPGAYTVSISGRTITVQRADNYKWETLQPKIIEAIEECLSNSGSTPADQALAVAGA